MTTTAKPRVTTVTVPIQAPTASTSHNLNEPTIPLEVGDVDEPNEGWVIQAKDIYAKIVDYIDKQTEEMIALSSLLCLCFILVSFFFFLAVGIINSPP